MDSYQTDLVFDLNDVHHDSLSLEGFQSCRYLFIVSGNSYTGENVHQLTSICKAIHIDPEKDIHVVQPGASGTIRIREINANADHVFLFGVSPESAGLSFSFPKNQFIEINKIFMMATEDLTTLQNNVELKKKLWLCLKQHFIDDKKNVL